MKKIILALTLSLLAVTAEAQKKSEIKLYRQAIAGASIASYEKYLAKYPSGFYAGIISGKLDTLLNVSPYDCAKSMDIAKGLMSDGSLFQSFPMRVKGVDWIVCICIKAEGLAQNNVRVVELELSQGQWKAHPGVDYTMSGPDEDCTSVDFYEDGSLQTIGGKKVFISTVLTSYGGNPEKESLGVFAYSPDDQAFCNESIFVGCKKSDGILEGRMLDLSSSKDKEIQSLLDDKLKKNKTLSFISDEDYKSDEAIRYWLDNNPDALTTASKVTAVKLEEKCSIVSEFLGKKGKGKTGSYIASMFDLRGYTLIVAQDRKSGSYILEWAEPACKNSRTDRLLNSISFTNSTTLEMFYYHGRRSYKYYLNLASKSLRR